MSITDFVAIFDLFFFRHKPMSKDDYYHIYLQPIAVSAGNQEGRHNFHEENLLQLITDSIQSPKVGRSPLKVRDLIRFNKGYKVYNNTIHFFNFLYVLQISKNGHPLLAHTLLNFKLTTKEGPGKSTSRSFAVPLAVVYQGLEHQQQLMETALFNCSNGVDRSQLAVNVFKSRTSISLRVLEGLLDEKNSVMFNSWSKQQIPEQYNITVKEPQKSLFSNFSPSQLLYDSVIKLDKTQSVETTHLNEKVQEVTQEGSFSKQQQKQVKKRKGSGDSHNNTAFYDQSPKFKRITRLRRSQVHPASICSDLQDQETTEDFSKTTKKLKRYSVNSLLLVGIGVIYWLMHPIVRC